MNMSVVATSSAVGITVAAVAVMGGTFAAAETAVPGDLLYPVKTNVNENIYAGFTFTTESEAELEADLAIRRLEETEKLAEDERLNAENRARLQQSFELHHSNAVQHANQIAARGDAENASEVMAEYHMHLEEREQAMRILADEYESMSGQLSIMIALAEATKVEVQQELNDYNARIEGSTTNEVDVDMKTKIEGDIIETETMLNDLRTSIDAAADVTAEVRTEVEADLTSAAESMNKARVEFQNKAYAEAQAATTAAKDFVGRVENRLKTEVESAQESSVDASVNAEVEAETSAQIEAEDNSVDTTTEGNVKSTLDGVLN